MKIGKGSWVLIHSIVLPPEKRATQVPEDTKKVPLEKWVKGFLLEDGQIGTKVSIKTITGRIEKGKLIEVNPSYHHGFGNFVPEILSIGLQLKEIMDGSENNE